MALRCATKACRRRDMNVQNPSNAVEQLRQALGQFQAALNVVDDAIALYSEKKKLLWCNKAFEDFTGSSRIQILGQYLEEWAHSVNLKDDSIEALNLNTFESIRDVLTDESHIFYRHHRGIDCTFMMKAHYAKFKANEKTLVLVIKNITDKYKALNLQRQAQLLEEQAMRCPLTGLLNRRGLYKKLELLLSEGMKDCITIVFCDVNKFKRINDTYGHDVGDQVLQQISSVLRQSIRKADFVSRIAGDEFVVAIISSPEKAKHVSKKIAERIINTLSRRHQFQWQMEAHQIDIKVSLGIAHGIDAIGIDELIRNADTAMYQAKSKHYGFCYYNTELKNESKIEEFIRKTSEKHMSDGLIPFHLQPITSIATNNVVGYEVLIRPMSANGVLIPAEKFIRFHEKNGLIKGIDELLISSVLLKLDRNLLADERFVSINVSALTLCSKNFADLLVRSIGNALMPFESIVIEITETGYIQSQTLLQDSVEILSSNGIRVFLDDFGVGQTGLIQLVNLPIHGFKIDSGLFKQSQECDKAFAILSSFAQFARQVKIALIVEGIEDQEDVAHLSKINVNLAQGYKFCPPMPQDMLTGKAKFKAEGLSCPTDTSIDNPFRKL